MLESFADSPSLPHNHNMPMSSPKVRATTLKRAKVAVALERGQGVIISAASCKDHLKPGSDGLKKRRQQTMRVA